MKFAKELEHDLVPEWRAKYLNYKGGKKKLKAVARAVRSVQSTPLVSGRRKIRPLTPSLHDSLGPSTFLNRPRARSAEPRQPRRSGDQAPRGVSAGSEPQEIPRASRPAFSRDGERKPLRNVEGEAPDRYTRYGSIISTPPSQASHLADSTKGRTAPLLELPEPALDSADPSAVDRVGVPQSSVLPAQDALPQRSLQETQSQQNLPGELKVPKRKKEQRFADSVTDPSHGPRNDGSTNAFQVGPKRSPKHGSHFSALRHGSLFAPKRTLTSPSIGGPGPRTPPVVRRVFSSIGGGASGVPWMGTGIADSVSDSDVQLGTYRELDERQAEFFFFLEEELSKIEEFYKEKELEATERLRVLREQLHIMRDRRLDELMSIRSAKMKKRKSSQPNGNGGSHNVEEEEEHPSDAPQQNTSESSDADQPKKTSGIKANWFKPLDSTLDQLYNGRVGKGSKAMGVLGTPPGPHPNDSRSDYVRRPTRSEIPYRTAKRKLKVALQEYYRGLELLKSYTLLNRKAFKKINKKYDKTVNARPALWFVNEKVNRAWFVQSQVLDGHLGAVEDLYARYFERGNHKVAAGKLRARTHRAGDFTASVFRNGLLLAGGAVFGVEGLVYAGNLLFDPDPETSTKTSYLLQIYAGYFLCTLLMLLFCLVCRIWSSAKINYVFVFEYDPRSHLDWRQLCELPSFCFFLLGLSIRLNFERVGGEKMYIYWPVVLLGITVLLLFFPARVCYYKSRLWFAYADWRLLLSGLYPVEFRDFFLGDMFCSLTYPFGNLELFFCLYANNWSNPAQCNSSHSRLLGFFSCLPGIWRALQCLRRYYDTRNVFPHLVNCGKYTFTILFYMSLSLYRINKSTKLRILFIVFASINSIYCSVWDLVMDWSLFNPYAAKPFLRDMLGYKRTWMYYTAMVIDPILRFNWIFYAIFADDVQHSAILSFFVALSEVLRRAMWTIFRVENEHCTNVGRFRASRDIPLPYGIESDTTTPYESPEQSRPETPYEPTPQGMATGADVEAQATPSTTRRRRRLTGPGTPLQRGTLSRVGTILHNAHAQDFERRRKSDDGAVGPSGENDSDDGAESDGERVQRMAEEEGLLDDDEDPSEESSSDEAPRSPKGKGRKQHN